MHPDQNRIQHLAGSPFAVGFQSGQALGSRLETNIARYLRERLALEEHAPPQEWRERAVPWLRHLPVRFQAEFEGLAEGSGVPLQRVAEWAYLEVFLTAQCSGALLEIDQQVWVARNNDIFAPGMWGYVTIREVADRIPTISFGLEGDVFTPTGINRARLWLHYHYLSAWDAPAPDAPCLPCYAWLVEALETCRDLNDLEALLAQVQRDDGMLLFAVDGKTGEYALYECTCQKNVRIEPSRGWLVGTNHYRAHPDAPQILDSGPSSSLSRLKRLECLVMDFMADPKRAQPAAGLIQMLGDEGVESREGDFVTAYANAACPAQGKLWYTFGGYPAASQGHWERLAWPW
jgi:hypothetical protein